MDIIIHRGTHQIGGCVTEIRTGFASIIIDMGAPLPGSSPGETTEDVEDIVSACRKCDAVFITHYHGDHIGRIDTLRPETPLYLGKAAKEIYNIYCIRTKQDEKVNRLRAAHIYTPGQPIQIKDITVTPLLTSHSALDAYMLLIEAEGRTVLHTGDFSLHCCEENRWLEAVAKTLADKGIASVDYLICEGTMLPGQVRTSSSELDVINQIITLMKKYKKVFVLCSSTHIDRIAEFYHHRNYHAPLVSDMYQNDVLQYVTDTYGKSDYFYRLPYAYTYSTKNVKLNDLMEEYGFVALIRPNYWSKWMLEHYYDEADSAIVYSMWSGYLKEGPAKNEYLCDFLKPYTITAFIHAGGHALPQEIRKFVDVVNPAHIIPVHTEYPEAMGELLPDREIVLLQDKDVLKV